MSKRDIDYSNTIIYKITSKDKTVTDLYVGHTVDFVQRKRAHKQSCINIKSSNHMCKVYQIIRANGGWANWKMVIIDFFECKNLCEARQKEQEYFISLNATLNSVEPFPTPTENEEKFSTVKEKCISKKEKICCPICDISFNSKKLIDIHNLTKKHKKNLSLIKKDSYDTVIRPSKYKCDKCVLTCERKPDWFRHISTPKHNKIINLNTELNLTPKYTCSLCLKEYKSNVGLWKHKKKCALDNTIQINNDDTVSDVNTNDKNIIELLIKENADFKNIVLEAMKSTTVLQQQMFDLCKTTTNNAVNSQKHLVPTHDIGIELE